MIEMDAKYWKEIAKRHGFEGIAERVGKIIADSEANRELARVAGLQLSKLRSAITDHANRQSEDAEAFERALGHIYGAEQK